jgi:hypothetical protein
MVSDSGHAFDDAEIDLLSAAFQKAWPFVEFDFALEPLDARERQSALAASLMHLAKRHDWEVLPLANAAIFKLRNNSPSFASHARMPTRRLPGR